MVAPMMVAAGLGVGTSLLSGLLGSKAQKKAMREQLIAQKRAEQLVRENNAKATDLLQPASDYRPALSQLMALNGLSGGQAQQDAFGAFRDTPGYQFQLDQGIGAMNRSAAARGTALSGRTLVDAQKLGQGLADQNFSNYYSRLSGLYGSQLGAAGDLAGIYTGQGSQLAGLAQGMGQIKADGITGQAGTWLKALQGAADSVAFGAGGWAGAKPNMTQSTFY